jgi:prolyl 4-hydroxylase
MAGELIERAEALFQSGQAQQAMDLLGSAARKNDPDALEYLGRMSVVGTIVHRDLRLARDLFRRAAAAGSKAGAAAYRAFLANGTGGPSNWTQAVALLAQDAGAEPEARRELALINSMSLTDDGEPKATLEGQQLSETPEAWTFPGIFSEAECDFLIDVAMPQLAPSLVVDPQTGQLVANPVRTSDAAGFPLMAESPAIHALCRRLAAASGTHANQGEPLQILRYRPGQQYRPHFDAIEGADNQRILTFLVYLNDDYRGGETRFESTGLEFKGRKGDGLLFRNASADGRPDLRSQHAGLPVLGGEKFLASRWIREGPLMTG